MLEQTDLGRAVKLKASPLPHPTGSSALRPVGAREKDIFHDIWDTPCRLLYLSMSPLNINHTLIVNCRNHIHNTDIPPGLKKNFPIPPECGFTRHCDSSFRSGGKPLFTLIVPQTYFPRKKVFCSYHTVIVIVLIDMVILIKIGFQK
jgi:hypothetical protein